MQMQVRCKGSHEFIDLFALSLVGGTVKDPELDRPTFVFPNYIIYQEYKRHKRELEGKHGVAEKSTKPVGKPTTRNANRRKFGGKHYI
ncbi:hypothetical protein [Paenibacillus cineris]|uniref:hypothetical protein n=1 Tax=Paenibacillus cineris TaxID=237530 RepID=UPI001B062691|nr:hypothetical protein [Paenibacillus cineris]GIO63540.1 hypothetical protein J43TS9_51140 [Paenibacillus cineris]